MKIQQQPYTLYVLTIYLITLCACVVDWQTEYGGITSYIAKGEDEEVRHRNVWGQQFK